MQAQSSYQAKSHEEVAAMFATAFKKKQQKKHVILIFVDLLQPDNAS